MSQKQMKEPPLNNEISDNEDKSITLMVTALGGIFFIAGVWMCVSHLPGTALLQNPVALLGLVFAVLGSILLCVAYRVNQAYQKFGPTPLLLQPTNPGVGGKFVASFVLNPKAGKRLGSAPDLQAMLICYRQRHSHADNSSSTIDAIWEQSAPVYKQYTAKGIEAAFQFDVPPDCENSDDSNVDWIIKVEGDFTQQGLGKFARSWPITIAKTAPRATPVTNIPSSFLDRSAHQAQEKAIVTANEQFPIVESDVDISLVSHGVFTKAVAVAGVLISAIFASIGVFVIASGDWGGIAFVLMGLLGAGISIYLAGRKLEVNFNKRERVLYSRRTFAGIPLAKRQVKVTSPDQFKILKIGATDVDGKVVSLYAILLSTDGEPVRVAEGVRGWKAAGVLKERIVDSFFAGEQDALAA